MEIKEIAKKIENNGGRLYLVGGAVRDKILRKACYDEDYCVVGLNSSSFLELFPMAKMDGKAFPVFRMFGSEFALARKEKKIGVGHKEFEVISGKEISLKEDLERRDITINAMAEDVLTGEIFDYFGGKEDLKNGIIRAIRSHFKEDPLRVYRVARFSSVLGFKVEEKTILMMNELKEELKYLSKERVFGEFRKALASKKPSTFFSVLRKADVLDVHFKPIYKLIGALQPEKYHPEGDSYNHTMICLDKSVKMTSDLKIRYSVLVHDLGKGETPKEEYPHHYGHEERGVEIVRKFSHDLGVPNAWKKCGIVAAKEHMRGGIFNKMKPSKKVEFIERIDKTYLGLEGLQIVVDCDKGGRIEGDLDFLTIGKKCLETITAKKVAKKYKLKPGIELGRKLHEERVTWIKHLTK